MSSNGARRFEPMCRSQLSQVAVAMVSCSKIEALLTSTVSGRPSAAAAAGTSARRRRPVEQVRLHHRRPHPGRRAPPRPAPRRPARLAWQWIATSAPRAASARTSAAPEPLRPAGDQGRVAHVARDWHSGLVQGWPATT